MDYQQLLKILSRLIEGKSDGGVIVLGGIHGSGKSTLANLLERNLPQLNVVKASEILNHTSIDKRVDSIEGNQKILANYILSQNTEKRWLLIDGHFSIINKDGHPTFVGYEIFDKISPSLLILMDSDAEWILKNRRDRDKEHITMSEIKRHSDFERQMALDVAKKFKIDLISLDPSSLPPPSPIFPSSSQNAN